jgi:hypothetical protein
MSIPNHPARKLITSILATAFAGAAPYAEALPDLVVTKLSAKIVNDAPEPGRCRVEVKWTETNRGDQDTGSYCTKLTTRVGQFSNDAFICSNPLPSRDRTEVYKQI